MNDTERELRDAVRSYAEGVEPADRLGEIRRATAEKPRRTRTRLLVGGVAVATAAVVLGFAVLVGPGGDDAADTPAAATTEVTVYEVGKVGGQSWLYPEQVLVQDSGDPVYDAVAAQLAGGHGSCLTGDLQSVDVAAEQVTVHVAGKGVWCTSDDGLETLMTQVAWTVRDAIGHAEPVYLSSGEGTSPQPYTADPNALSPVLLDSPTDGATVASPLTVEGRGNTFEGNVQWQVLSGGDVVDEGFETAGTMGDFRPFSFTVDLEPGNYTVRVFAISMEDGRLFAEDTASVTVD